jgi:hypothetical protein
MYRPLNSEDILLIASLAFVILVCLLSLLLTFPIDRRHFRKRRQRLTVVRNARQ